MHYLCTFIRSILIQVHLFSKKMLKKGLLLWVLCYNVKCTGKLEPSI